MKTIILTSDFHSWLLQGFFHQWEKYAEPAKEHVFGEIEVAGFSRPDNLPNYAKFASIGRIEDYPIDKWSTAVIKYLQSLEDEFVTIFLEDYWLIRPINFAAIRSAMVVMDDIKHAVRFDLTSDRMFSKDAVYAGHYGGIDLCYAKGDYSLSFQAGIYRRELLIDVLVPNESPWLCELNSSYRLNRLAYAVLGSYQWPVNYAIVVNKGKFDRDGKWMYPARTLTPQDWAELDLLGYTSKTEREYEHSL